ncbi:glycosyltransferase family 4 protein [Bacillus sp. V3B]|nr:glycosyltransferase family 4 protein [Bacillus sp. V3B]
MRGKRKILVLTWEFPPHIVGGLSRHVYGLTKSLSKMGYEIHVITARQEQLPVYERSEGVFVHRVNPLNENEKDFLIWIGGLNIALSEKAETLAHTYQFDCIHAHDWLVGAAASVLKNRLAIPLVTTIHATEFGRNNGIYTEMQSFIHEKERKLVEQSDQIIVCSDYMKQEIQQLFNPPIEKVITIPNGIDSESEIVVGQEGVLNGIPIDPSRKMIFSIGRIVKEKGFDTLIETAAILKKKGSNIYFLIAGKGPMLDEYRRKVDELQLTDTVFFIGFVDDNQRNKLFEHCDITVFPSLYEPFGIVALESMKANKPTIVSNTGGLKGIVQHLKTGLLMIPGSTDSLIEQIMRLLNDPNLAKQVGENGKRIVESLFSWNRVAEETKRVFEEVKINGKL